MRVHVGIHLELDEAAAKAPLLRLLDTVENKASDAFSFMEGVTLTQLLVAPVDMDDAPDQGVLER